MLKTSPRKTQGGIGCTKLFVRFKAAKIADQMHHTGDVTGAKLMVINWEESIRTVLIEYVAPDATVLKTVMYSREDVLELTPEESVCNVEAGHE